ncbi:YeeE/YedE family protein [Sulfitobacter sp. M57]|uniref:YeeE/YedE family protein n=1 Tax=unclassified Sulfitobacter TaxID=196795 RepID=UPI0023E126E5|nr:MULTISPECIES: YeeE/YedE family protein [unclassified Sulfitobacter]MDF3415958.1 YeeE/YedE family protein [Sulfitobacter sp. KE5]MDF3423438.1 YeeE/YedE family protein [Sulfitobacter sp. KE43]MDF3434504.1 YeeE/YedE family protein [Sulfitobacter sp. KE42]MDF3460144.1 YeeE/YedE family protein [Sulfitobacter sp. S74]MDF3464042.1 YeeE/YedE family protein [Sulfitobacter sp. Ks18]
MYEMVSEPAVVALVGLIGGVLLGLAARIGRFCTLGAIEDLYYGENTLRLRMWGVAIGVAVIGTFGLSALGLLDLGQTLYLTRAWNPAESIIGGLIFGYGMALAGNCGYGALARVGGGDLRSLLIILIMGISAYVTLGGPLSGLRIWLFGGAEPAGKIPTFAYGVSQITGVSVNAAGVLIGCVILAVTLLNRSLRQSYGHVFWGAIAGLSIVSGWAGTQWVANTGFDATPVVSHTFSAPIGETILYVMTASGNTVGFGTGSVVGVLLGAFLGSVIKGHFRWEACDDPRELRRQILGAALMGAGAVVAVGCSVGQGLSAFSVLSFSAPLTLICILIGAAIGLRQLILGFAPSL